MDNKKIILILIIFFAIIAVVGFYFFNSPSQIPCKTINVHDKYDIDVPINSSYKRENGLDYYESDIAKIIIFSPEEKAVSQVTKNEIGLYESKIVYSNEEKQKGSEIMGTLIDKSIHDNKVTVDGVHMFYDEIDKSYSMPRNSNYSSFLITSKDPHVVAQLTNSIKNKF